MSRFILRRLLRGFVALFLFQTLLFGLISSVPFDFSVTQIGGGREWREFIRQLMGLDLPLWQQYLNWMRNFFTFNLGRSFQFWPTPVSQVLLGRASRTLLLFLTSAVVAYLIGIWLGKMVAWRRGGLLELGISVGGVASFTSFAPWLGFLMLNVFAWYLGWLPYQRLVNPRVWFNAPISVESLLGWMLLTVVVGFGVLAVTHHFSRQMRDPQRRAALRWGVFVAVSLFVRFVWQASGLGKYALDILKHLALPLTTVVLLSFGDTMMLMRMAMIDTLQDDFVITARAKGLPEKVIRDQHVARNAIFPVLTRLLLNLPFVLVGSLIIEIVFTWQGMGITLFRAIEVVDLPVLMGILSFVGVLTLGVHIILDILYVLLDPRLRYEAEERKKFNFSKKLNFFSWRRN